MNTANPRTAQPALTIDVTLRVLRIIHSGLLVSMFLYIYVAEKVLVYQPKHPDTVFFNSIAVLAIAIAGATFIVRSKMIGPAIEALRTNPSDTNAIARWRVGLIIADVFAESIVLFGFALRAVGAPVKQVVPFYIAGPILMLFWWPRRP